jgi:hypothetical protein
MKRIFLVSVVLVLLAGLASSHEPLAPTTQKWTAGWDNFSEPLNLTKSNIVWSVNGTTRNFSVTFNLLGASPTKLY